MYNCYTYILRNGEPWSSNYVDLTHVFYLFKCLVKFGDNNFGLKNTDELYKWNEKCMFCHIFPLLSWISYAWRIGTDWTINVYLPKST